MSTAAVTYKAYCTPWSRNCSLEHEFNGDEEFDEVAGIDQFKISWPFLAASPKEFEPKFGKSVTPADDIVGSFILTITESANPSFNM